MANLRLIYDNAADRATIVASSTAGALVAGNLKTDYKAEVHRSTGTSVTHTLTWANFENVGGVFYPACNLGPSATIRVRAYDATSGGTLLADTGTVYACPGLNLELWDWSDHLNAPRAVDANAFAYGGASKAGTWLAETVAAKRVVVDLSDPENEAGYIDCGRIVAGGWWSPTWNPPYGAKLGLVDTSKLSRMDSGDLATDRGTRHETSTMQLQYMPEIDRARFLRILRGNGLSRLVLLSLFPGSDEPTLEQDNLIYGSLQDSGATIDFFNAYTGSITIEGW